MKMYKNLLLLLFTTILLFSCSDSKIDNNSASTESAITTTFMVYAVGSDLESDNLYGSINIQEMLQASTGDRNTNIIIQTGAAKHTMENPVITDNENKQIPIPVKDWSTIQLHKIHNGTLTTLEHNLGKSCIEDEIVPNCTSMNKGNITDFIKKAAKYAPADRYVLILWNHGGGSILGYGDQANNSSVIDIKNAVADSGIHFDIIGFDACLMGSLETAYTLKDYADYFIGSEELESGYGWNYEDFLNELAANNSISSRELAIKITEAYHDRYSKYEQLKDADHTLSAIDLKQIENLKDAFEKHTQDMVNKINTPDEWIKFNNARQISEYYGDYAAMQTLHVDLQNIIELYNHSPNINEAIKNAVISNKTDRVLSHGISIFIPYYYEVINTGQSNTLINLYNKYYNSILPNNVEFAKKLVDIAAPGLNGNTTITDTDSKVIDNLSNITYSGNINSKYGFREINLLAYYKNNNNDIIIGTPFIESIEMNNLSLTDFKYNMVAKKGIIELTNFDNTLAVTPYAVDLNIDNQTKQNTYALPIFYANSEQLKCIDELQKNNSIQDDEIEYNCNIQKYIMELTLNNNLAVISVDKDLKAYDSQNNKIAIQLKPGEAVFIDSATIGSENQFETSFNADNKFIIQNNIKDTFKVHVKEQIDTNYVKFILLVQNHAGGIKNIDMQNSASKIDKNYKYDAETLVHAYNPRP